MAKGIWNRSHYLDRMTLKELWIAYFQYPAIIAYIALTVVSAAVWDLYPATPLQTLAAAGATVLAYPPLLAAWAPFFLFLLIGETVLIRSEE